MDVEELDNEYSAGEEGKVRDGDSLYLFYRLPVYRGHR